MKYFVVSLFLIGFFLIFSQNSDAFIATQCNELELKENHVILQFLTLHPSSTFEKYQTSDESGNQFTQIEYRHNGIGLDVSFDNNSENCMIGTYDVSYDYPSSGLGVSLTRSKYFESNQTQQAIAAIKDLTNPRKQMKEGVPLYEIKCREGLTPTIKRDRITPACVTDSTWNGLLLRGWSPLRIGMPAETNILITYNATTVFPQKVTKEYDPRSPYFNMVFFVNNDIVPHTVKATDERWSTGVIESGKTGSMSFNQTGSFRYYIEERPTTVGRIQFDPLPEPDLESDIIEGDTVSENKKPYTLYDISGIKQIYKVGEPISFTETVQGYANPCIHPHYKILDGNTLETVWQYKIVYPCPFIKDPQQFKKINTIPNDSTPSPILNQTGTYILRSYYSYSDGYKEVTFSVVDESIGERENEN